MREDMRLQRCMRIGNAGAAGCRHRPGPCGAAAAAERPTHGLSAFGELKYPADFKHFEWVNPDAPKGGRLATIGTGARTTFDSFNGFILKGDAAQGLGLSVRFA